MVDSLLLCVILVFVEPHRSLNTSQRVLGCEELQPGLLY